MNTGHTVYYCSFSFGQLKCNIFLTEAFRKWWIADRFICQGFFKIPQNMPTVIGNDSRLSSSSAGSRCVQFRYFPIAQSFGLVTRFKLKYKKLLSQLVRALNNRGKGEIMHSLLA